MLFAEDGGGWGGGEPKEAPKLNPAGLNFLTVGEPAVSLPELFPPVGLANLDMTSKGRLTGEAPEEDPEPALPELKAERKPSPAPPFVDEEAPCIFNFSKICKGKTYHNK